ncbi:HtrA protease/chaperone protein [Mucinivorans hirudinis]|uniref:HtrA protease/chaperone protein n=1 Tax=Mucinivorans hirudinis TaxID=1433126 RepID=A0A060RA14_9BACT|nr:HtrA protease/chaperone protein [Mucinivorans hirudinis]
MKKRVVLLTILASALVGGASAFFTTNFCSPTNSGYSFTVGDNGVDSNLKFVNNPLTENILPDFTQAAEKGVKSVVNIEIVKKVAIVQPQFGGDDMFEYFFGNPNRNRGQGQQQTPQYQEQRGGGSGVIISEDGYIVSNNHVVEDATEVMVTTSDGEKYTAKVIGTDPATDIALIKIDAKNLPTLQFGNSDSLRLGEWVLAVGNPYGLTSTVTQGIVSAKGRTMGMQKNSKLEIESFIQTDAAVNRGNSGGALITLDGSLVGINTMVYSPTGSYTGYSFAIPSSIVRKVVADIMEFGVAQRAFLGIQMGEITADWLERFGKEAGIKERGGIYIGEVVENGAAAAAGIKKGDVLISINEQKTNSVSDVYETISRYRPNDKVKISIKRDGEMKHFEVTLRNKTGNTDVVRKQELDLAKFLGARFDNVTDAQKKQLSIKGGVQVISLLPDGLLARSRVKVGYIITAINDIAINNIAQFESINIQDIELLEGIYPDGRRMSYGTIAK